MPHGEYMPEFTMSTSRPMRRPLIRALLLGAAALVAATAAAAPLAPPLKMSLAAFDGARRAARLPNGVTMGYVEAGNPNGQPVVLIHGFTDSARDWLPLIPELDRSLRLIVVDIRGHGKTSKPECCYGRIDFAYDVRLLLDVLHVKQADIVGHSLGSYIAQTFAEYWPERTRRVVLVSSSGGPLASCAPPPGQAAVPSMDYRGAIAKLKEPIDPDSPFMVEWWSSPTPVDEAFIRRQRQDAAAIPLRVWLAVLDQGLAGPALQATLPRLKATTLLIWGGKDPIFGAEDRCSLTAALPNAEVRLYPDLGHNPFWEEPQTIAAAINPFLLAKP
jgi:pimeloyl-ACP methyl ester carboxylesterase